MRPQLYVGSIKITLRLAAKSKGPSIERNPSEALLLSFGVHCIRSAWLRPLRWGWAEQSGLRPVRSWRGSSLSQRASQAGPNRGTPDGCGSRSSPSSHFRQRLRAMPGSVRLLRLPQIL